jgi:hypothetical protein
MMKKIVPMAIGMAAGVGAQHFLLRPLEKKIAEKMPMAAKFMAVGEILLGGFVAIKAKNPIMQGVGLGIMAGGVNSGVKQLNLYHESPAVQGVGDYTTVRIPVNGQLRSMLNGIVRDQHGETRTHLVAGAGWDNYSQSRTNLLAGIYGLGERGYAGDSEADNYLQPKGW